MSVGLEKTQTSSKMTAATKPQSFVKLYCFCVVSSLLATVSSATADDGPRWSACAPIDGRCPPGFLLSDNGNSCVCGSEDDALPIDRCDERRCRAYLRSGYWAGYVKGDYGTNGSRLEREGVPGDSVRVYKMARLSYSLGIATVQTRQRN